MTELIRPLTFWGSSLSVFNQDRSLGSITLQKVGDIMPTFVPGMLEEGEAKRLEVLGSF